MIPLPDIHPPLINASGILSYPEVFTAFESAGACLGGYVTKSVGPREKPGNDNPVVVYPPEGAVAQLPRPAHAKHRGLGARPGRDKAQERKTHRLGLWRRFQRIRPGHAPDVEIQRRHRGEPGLPQQGAGRADHHGEHRPEPRPFRRGHRARARRDGQARHRQALTQQRLSGRGGFMPERGRGRPWLRKHPGTWPGGGHPEPGGDPRGHDGRASAALRSSPSTCA